MVGTNLMKQLIVRILALLAVTTLLSGCAWEVGGGDKHVTVQPTVGQQLVDLQRARDAGAITDSEFQAQKARILRQK